MEAAAQALQGQAAGMGGQAAPAERLSSAVQQQLNLDSVRIRAIGLSKNIARILEDFDAFSRSNMQPKWYYSTFLVSPYDIIVNQIDKS